MGDYYWKFSYQSSTFKVYGGFATQNCNHVYDEKILKVLTAKGIHLGCGKGNFQSFISFVLSKKILRYLSDY